MTFLVTGCGRSGTGYTVDCLRLAGLNVGWECEGRDGAVSWLWAAPGASYPAYHQQGPRPSFDVVVHQVREPLATIGSVTTFREDTWDFVQTWTPIEAGWEPVRKAAHYWYWWNKRVEGLEPGMRYRIEDLEEEWPVLMAVLGHDVPYRGAAVSRRKNSRPHEDVSWLDVQVAAPDVCRRIALMARRYGYELEGGL